MQTNIQKKDKRHSNRPKNKRLSLGFSKIMWEVFPLVLGIFTVLVLLRTYLYVAALRSPFFEGQQASEVWYGVFFDLWLVLITWFFIAFLKRFLYGRVPRLTWVFIGLFVFLVIIASIATDQYFLISGQALDSTFFYFSWEEIWIISGVQDRLTIGMIGGLLAIGVLMVAMHRWLKKKVTESSFNGHRYLSIFVFVACISSPFSVFMDVENETRQGLINNRLLFFIHDGLAVLFRSSESDQQVHLKEFELLHSGFYGGDKSKGVFPLYRTLVDDQGWEDVFYKTSDGKPPNVVLIIVESMSSDFFGERANNTGCLMPFMDSLSKNSIYYPNGFSTSQRTHNVLPAVLSSVPNVVDGNAFQQIAYPNHWGLPGLLKRHYYSRFYCGVSLEYLNMRGFFNYHNTDYLVNRWSKRNRQLNSAVDSPWGYPDGALFNQGANDTPYDGNKMGKRLMDVYLTISTHDPFVYPNKAYYSNLVRIKSEGIRSEKHRKVIYNQAEGLGSFLYTDGQLRTFFQAWKMKKAYRNTIFILTGDHGSELYPINKLTKYNVPLLVYSPLLKEPRTIKRFVSHLDIPPTLISYLKKAYRLKLPDKTPFVGKVLPLKEHVKGNRVFMFMTNKLRSNEMLFEKTAFLENKTYRVDKNLQLYEEHNATMKRFLQRQITLYQLFSFYVIHQNKLLPSSDHVKWYGISAWRKTASKEVQNKSIDLRKKLNHLGTYTSGSIFQGKIKIQLCLNVSCATKKDLDQLPDLVISDRPLKWLKKEWMLFKAVRPVLLEKFKRGKLIKVAYTLEFDSRQMPYFKRNNSLCFMWNNPRLNAIPRFSNLEWRVFTKKE